MRRISRITAIILSLLLMLSVAGCSASDGKIHLTFQIWDVYQRPGMQAMCDAYTEKNPNVVIEVQATSWNEYWTKLEAAAESNTLPDIFWMHTNQLLYYADFGMLADVTHLYDDIDPQYYEKHFSDISRSNASGSDGNLYGVPKDKDNGHLVYNKEMFDAAGVTYPTDDWTWDDLVSASEQIYNTTGKYGFMAYNDDQLGYWPFVYQAGGYILNEVLERLRKGYPEILIEGCCGGGGRFDGGMLYYTPQIWCSDDSDAIDRLRIQYGTSFCYPPCTMGAHVSAVPNEQNGRITPLQTRGIVAMSGAFGYEMDLGKCTAEEREEIRRQVETYKRHEKLIYWGDYYRLSDPFSQDLYTAWEHVSEDQKEALVSLVMGTTRFASPFQRVYLKGLNPSFRYQINKKEVYKGSTLMEVGYPLLEFSKDYTSMQLYLEAI